MISPKPAGRVDRLSWVDAGRGLAICLVALYHSTSWLSGAGLHLETWKAINDAVASLRMPLFFVLSGLFARKWLSVDWSALFSVKIRLFAWVFLVWSTIGSAVILLTLILAGHPESAMNSLKLYLLSPVLPRFELWFLWALMLFFVVAKATRKLDYRLQLAVAGVISAGALSVWLLKTTGYTGAAKYYFFFLVGLYLREYVAKFSAIDRRSTLISVVVAWATVSASLTVFGLRAIFPLYFLNCLLGVLAGVCVSRTLARFAVIRGIGRNTLPIYVAHTPTIILIVTILGMTPAVPGAQPIAWLLPPVLAFVAVSAAVLLHRVSSTGPLRFLYEPPAALSRARVRLRRPAPEA